MSAEECIVLNARLSRRLAIEINMTRTGHVHCVWDPDLPEKLTRKEQRAYEKFRNEALTRLVEMMAA